MIAQIHINQRQPAAGSDGFTLIELLVAIAMLAVLLGIGVPSFMGYIQDNRIISEVNRVIAHLNYSRSEASSRASAVTLEHKSGNAGDWAAGWEIYTDLDATGNSTRVGADTLLRDVGEVSQGITVDANIPGNTWISYRPNGMLNEGGNAILIAVCDERGEANGRDISISLSGRVTVATPSADCTP